MVFARYLRPLLLLIGAAIGALVLAQFAVTCSEAAPAESSAKAICCDFSAAETGEGGDADICGEEPNDEVFFRALRVDGDIQVSSLALERLSDRRGATLVGLVQLLI